MEYLEESLDDWLGEELQASARSPSLHAHTTAACLPGHRCAHLRHALAALLTCRFENN